MKKAAPDVENVYYWVSNWDMKKAATDVKMFMTEYRTRHEKGCTWCRKCLWLSIELDMKKTSSVVENVYYWVSNWGMKKAALDVENVYYWVSNWDMKKAAPDVENVYYWVSNWNMKKTSPDEENVYYRVSNWGMKKAAPDIEKCKVIKRIPRRRWSDRCYIVI